MAPTLTADLLEVPLRLPLRYHNAADGRRSMISVVCGGSARCSAAPTHRHWNNAASTCRLAQMASSAWVRFSRTT
jgi:hypothetical protein